MLSKYLKPPINTLKYDLFAINIECVKRKCISVQLRYTYEIYTQQLNMYLEFYLLCLKKFLLAFFIIYESYMRYIL